MSIAFYAGPRQPIVLVAETTGDFAFVQSMLGRRGQVAEVALDGGSGPDRLAEAIDAIEGDEPVTLIGHSRAAAVCVDRAAVDRRVTSLILIAAVTEVSTELSRIRAATLVVGCTEDERVSEAHSLALVAGISNARYASLDSGHDVLRERPAELLYFVEAFLDEPGRYPVGATMARMRP